MKFLRDVTVAEIEKILENPKFANIFEYTECLEYATYVRNNKKAYDGDKSKTRRELSVQSIFKVPFNFKLYSHLSHGETFYYLLASEDITSNQFARQIEADDFEKGTFRYENCRWKLYEDSAVEVGLIEAEDTKNELNYLSFEPSSKQEILNVSETDKVTYIKYLEESISKIVTTINNKKRAITKTYDKTSAKYEVALLDDLISEIKPFLK